MLLSRGSNRSSECGSRVPSNQTLLKRCHCPATSPALTPSHDPAAPRRAGVDYPEVLAPAPAAFEAALVLCRISCLSLCHMLIHGSFRVKSFCVYRFRCRPAAASPEALTPAIDTATAQPTRQSNQWLQGLDGLGLHSCTVRPRPAVTT